MPARLIFRINPTSYHRILQCDIDCDNTDNDIDNCIFNGVDTPTIGEMHSYRLIFYYQNVRGLRTESKDLYLATSAMNYDLIALTETWLTPQQLSNEYFCSDYVVFRCDRSSSTSNHLRAGGVLIAVPRKLNCVEITHT